MNAASLQALAQAFTERMLNAAAEGMILAGLLWALRPLIRRQNSGTRFAIWFLALAAIVALPLFAASGLGASHSMMIAPAKLHREITLSASWAYYLFAAWAAGASLLLLRLSVGLWRVYRFRRHCRPLESTHLDPALAAILRDFGSHRRVSLCVSSELSAPAAIGFLRPAIVFPAWLLPQLSAAEIEVILLHEYAHLCRWDHWTNLAQKFVRAVFFFHPAVWWIETRLTLEREMACDDLVLAQSASPRVYASFLITFAEKLQNARGLALAQALMSRTRQMSLRVAQILDAKRPPCTRLWKPVVAVGVGLLAVVFGAAPYVPQLVAFQNQPAPNQTAPMHPAGMAKSAKVTTAWLTRGGHRKTEGPPSADAGRLRAIPAAYHPRTAVLPMRPRTAAPSKPAVTRPPVAIPAPGVIQAKAAQKQLPGQQTFVILQATEYDASGSDIWTLCILRVEGGKAAARQLESAIVLSI